MSFDLEAWQKEHPGRIAPLWFDTYPEWSQGSWTCQSMRYQRRIQHRLDAIERINSHRRKAWEYWRKQIFMTFLLAPLIVAAMALSMRLLIWSITE